MKRNPSVATLWEGWPGYGLPTWTLTTSPKAQTSTKRAPPHRTTSNLGPSAGTYGARVSRIGFMVNRSSVSATSAHIKLTTFHITNQS